MNNRVIRVCIEKEPKLYEELESAMMNYTQYEGCYIMQYSEYRGSEGWMIGEFMLREAGTHQAQSSWRGFFAQKNGD